MIEFIARKVVSNIRELEGALNRIVAYASMGAMPISIELAQAVLSNVLYNPKKRQITPERIVKAVSEYYGVGLDQLKGQKRDKAIVVPRQIAMFLMREETDVSLLRIGAELGGRDHSTVLHACDKITRESSAQRRAPARDRRGPRADLRRLTPAPLVGRGARADDARDCQTRPRPAHSRDRGSAAVARRFVDNRARDSGWTGSPHRGRCRVGTWRALDDRMPGRGRWTVDARPSRPGLHRRAGPASPSRRRPDPRSSEPVVHAAPRSGRARPSTGVHTMMMMMTD